MEMENGYFTFQYQIFSKHKIRFSNDFEKLHPKIKNVSKWRDLSFNFILSKGISRFGQVEIIKMAAGTNSMFS